jgi:hypothetical protein
MINTNYRIRKEDDGLMIIYFPQRRFLGIWWDVLGSSQRPNKGFASYERANEEICRHVNGKKIEYLDVNWGAS